MLNRTDWTECDVVSMDGKQASVCLPRTVVIEGSKWAPDWLVRQMGLSPDVRNTWRLRPHRLASTEVRKRVDDRMSVLCYRPILYLLRPVVAGAMPFDPRQARLQTERLRLEKLKEESDYVEVEALDALEGSEPEHYKVKFYCQGIVGIDGAKRPKFDNAHEVEIWCDEEFPADVPRLRWVTPIWHPNIQHAEPKGVCVNKSEWLGGMSLVDLCRQLFEMVQYKNYHAEHSPPYPLDQMVAQWVREYAEPNGIVDKKRSIFVDDRPFTRPTVSSKISLVSASASPRAPAAGGRRVKLVSAPAQAGSESRASRVKLVATSKGAPPQQLDGLGGGRIRIVK